MSSTKKENESQKRTIVGVEKEVVGEIEMVVKEEEGGNDNAVHNIAVLVFLTVKNLDLMEF